jgi:UDP-3-O-[3-hydroxymyristoyl] glucosamine N-acyltransferase
VSAARPSFTTASLAERLGGTLRGAGDVVITGLNTPAEAGPGDLTFVGSAAYAKLWPNSRAAAAVITEPLVAQLGTSDSRPLIVVANTDVAMVQALEAFQRPEIFPDEGVHPLAWVHPDAQLGAGVRIGPHVSVDRGARIGDNVVLQPGVSIHANVVVGAGSILHANTVVRHECVLGSRVILHQNVSIGADGFGYRPAPGGRGLLKMPHIGNVIIEDDVEIGANSCVDRGKFGATVVGAGSKIDNLCQIAHNVRVGRCCVIAACAAIGGSVEFGDGVLLGGSVGISDHLKIGAGARIGGGSIVYSDVPAGATWLGFPAAEAGVVKRYWVAQKRLPELLRKLR